MVYKGCSTRDFEGFTEVHKTTCASFEIEGPGVDNQVSNEGPAIIADDVHFIDFIFVVSCAQGLIQIRPVHVHVGSPGSKKRLTRSPSRLRRKVPGVSLDSQWHHFGSGFELEWTTSEKVSPCLPCHPYSGIFRDFAGSSGSRKGLGRAQPICVLLGCVEPITYTSVMCMYICIYAHSYTYISCIQGEICVYINICILYTHVITNISVCIYIYVYYMYGCVYIYIYVFVYALMCLCTVVEYIFICAHAHKCLHNTGSSSYDDAFRYEASPDPRSCSSPSDASWS